MPRNTRVRGPVGSSRRGSLTMAADWIVSSVDRISLARWKRSFRSFARQRMMTALRPGGTLGGSGLGSSCRMAALSP